MANPGKKCLGMTLSPSVRAAQRNLSLVLIEYSRSHWASICYIEDIMFNGRSPCILLVFSTTSETEYYREQELEMLEKATFL